MSRTRVILVGGLIAAALDISYACIVYGPVSFHLSPTEVLQSVASGWVGNDAANAGGAVTALLGLTTDFMIATAMAAAFVLSAGRLSAVRRQPVLSGLRLGLYLHCHDLPGPASLGGTFVRNTLPWICQT